MSNQVRDYILVRMKGKDWKVKCLSNDKDYRFEVWAPDGHQFVDGCHSHLVPTKHAALEEISERNIELCPKDCTCNEEEDHE